MKNMKMNSIKSHLSEYSISRKRKTTINHAFASAIAPVDEYNEVILKAALQLLGQDADCGLTCVYCESSAETWDHLIGLVENAELRGYGHQIGNLVPCCKTCNSKKGSKPWKDYLQTKVPEPSAFETKCKQVVSYLEHYAIPVDLRRAEDKFPVKWQRYCEIKEEIFKLMDEADVLAKQLRCAVVTKKLSTDSIN